MRYFLKAYIHTHTYIYIYMYICIYVYMYICIYVYMYICIYVYMYICICIYIYIYTYMSIICVYVYVHVYHTIYRQPTRTYAPILHRHAYADPTQPYALQAKCYAADFQCSRLCVALLVEKKRCSNRASQTGPPRQGPPRAGLPGRGLPGRGLPGASQAGPLRHKQDAQYEENCWAACLDRLWVPLVHEKRPRLEVWGISF